MRLGRPLFRYQPQKRFGAAASFKVLEADPCDARKGCPRARQRHVISVLVCKPYKVVAHALPFHERSWRVALESM
jgi:hypothetical protein